MCLAVATVFALTSCAGTWKPLRDVAVYDRNAYWPDAIVRLEEARGAGRRFLRVEIFPIQYNPVRGRLRVHRGLSVVLSKREVASNE